MLHRATFLRAVLAVLAVAGVLAVTPGYDVAQRKLSDANGDASDYFGRYVAVSSQGTVVVGANQEDGGSGNPLTDAGAAFVYQLSAYNETLEHVATLRAPSPVAYDVFGEAVAVDGTTIAVGMPGPYFDSDPTHTSGRVHIYETNNVHTGSWTWSAEINGDDAAANDGFGLSVALSGDLLVVGAPYHDDPLFGEGIVYVFERTSGTTTWTQIDKLQHSATTTFERYGYAVAITQSTLAVGAPYAPGGPANSVSGAGSVYVYHRNQGTGDYTLTNRVYNAPAAVDDNFGRSVYLTSDLLAVGATGAQPGAVYNTGGVYVFTPTGAGGTWEEETAIFAGDSTESSNFGVSVAIADDEALYIGAPSQGDGSGAEAQGEGAVYVYRRMSPGSTTWIQAKKIRAFDGTTNTQIGYGVSVADPVVVASCPDGQAGNSTNICADCDGTVAGSILGLPCTCADGTEHIDGVCGGPPSSGDDDDDDNGNGGDDDDDDDGGILGAVFGNDALLPLAIGGAFVLAVALYGVVLFRRPAAAKDAESARASKSSKDSLAEAIVVRSSGGKRKRRRSGGGGRSAVSLDAASQMTGATSLTRNSGTTAMTSATTLTGAGISDDDGTLSSMTLTTDEARKQQRATAVPVSRFMESDNTSAAPSVQSHQAPYFEDA